MDIEKYECYKCSEQLQGLKNAMEHLKSHEIATNERLKCMKVQISCNLFCQSSFGTFTSLRTHMNENRCVLLCSDVQSDDENTREWSLVNEISELCLEENTPDETNSHTEKNAENFAAFISAFIAKLSAFNLQHNVLDEILLLSKELVSKTAEINEQLIRDNPKDEAEFIVKSTNDFVMSYIDTYTSRHRRNLLYEKSPCFVAPEALRMSRKYINDTLYYVPILKTLSCVFANCHFKKEYFVFNNSHKCQDGVYERFCCGQNYKKNDLFQSNKNAIQIQLFFDDFQLAAPLKTKTHRKVCGIYFTIHNFSPKCVSQLQNIYLISLCDSKVVENNGCNAILERLVHDIKQLETEGISIDSESTLKGTLVQVSFDNLGGNTIFGMVKCFNAEFYCRICICNKYKCQKTTREIAEKIRNVKQYNILMDKIRSLQESKTEIKPKETFGVLNYCILNDLHYYHSIDNRSQDIMHDVYEGAMPFVLKNLFARLVSRGLVTKEKISEKVLSFNYGILERRNIPSLLLINKANLNQNASQTRCLMIHIPFIFVDLLQLENEEDRKYVHKVWKVVEYLLKINQIISSTVIREADLANLETYTEEFLRNIKTIYGAHLIPKLHFMTHYVNTIRVMGPIAKLQMMRGDAKHQTFTRYAIDNQ